MKNCDGSENGSIPAFHMWESGVTNMEDRVHGEVKLGVN